MPLDYARGSRSRPPDDDHWVETKTNHKITDLLKPGMVNSRTRLVLANAIYFKGNWAAQFDPKATRDQPFHLTPSKKVKPRLMTHKGQYRFAALPELQVLELPYADSDLSMIVFLPQKVDGIGWPWSPNSLPPIWRTGQRICGRRK